MCKLPLYVTFDARARTRSRQASASLKEILIREKNGKINFAGRGEPEAVMIDG
jgi:hypothetical protein